MYRIHELRLSVRTCIKVSTMESGQKKIIIAESLAASGTALVATLRELYQVLEVDNGIQVLELVQNNDIDCIVMALVLPLLDGLKTTHDIKSNFTTYHIPIILLMDEVVPELLVQAVQMGADDFMCRPVEASDLKARVFMNIRRAERDQNANPLTRLPGNAIINRTVMQRLKVPLAVLYVDLDNFKAYNDKYGFNKGDDVIMFTAEVLSFVTKNKGNPGDFVGHIGGDDFVVITSPDRAEALAKDICTSFDAQAASFYSDEDRGSGKIIVTDRQGALREFSLVSLSIGIVSNEKKELTSMLQIAEIAAELKHYAKTKPSGELGSNFVKDRRN